MFNTLPRLLSLLKELEILNSNFVELFVDSKSAISMAKNLIFDGKIKHIETKFHFLRDHKGMIQLKYWRIEDQLTDILTNALKIDRFKKLRDYSKLKQLVC